MLWCFTYARGPSGGSGLLAFQYRGAPGDPAGRSSRARGGGRVLRFVVLPGGAALAARREVILCVEDIRRVDRVLMEDKVVTRT